MPQPIPTTPQRTHSFRQHSQTQPGVPQDGARLDAEFDKLSDAHAATLAFARQVVADDGRVKASALIGVDFKGPAGDDGAQGPQGPKGDPGPEGGQGPRGLQGIQGVEGPQGAQGLAGQAGPRGDNFDPDAVGVSSDRSTYDSAPTNFSFVNTDAGTIEFKLSPTTGDWSDPIPFGRGEQGEQGPQGIQGIQGVQGPEGPQGPQGIQGVAGTDGTDGIDGTDGATIYTETGTGAPDPAFGKVGDFVIKEGNSDVYEKTGATAWTLKLNLQGIQGPQGAQGIQGLQGPQGPEGPPGDLPSGAEILSQLLDVDGEGSGLDADRLAGVQAADYARRDQTNTFAETQTFAQDVIVTGNVRTGQNAGEVAFFAMQAPPFGWLKANGAAVSRTVYAALFAAIGTTYGAGDGSTTFNLPDLRGEFLRGWDDGRGADTARIFGSDQSWMIERITGEFTFRTDAHDLSGAFGNPRNNGRDRASFDNNENGTLIDFDSGRVAKSGNETRPRNVALLACINYGVTA